MPGLCPEMFSVFWRESVAGVEAERRWESQLAAFVGVKEGSWFASVLLKGQAPGKEKAGIGIKAGE